MFQTEAENFEFENICFGRSGGISCDDQANSNQRKNTSTNSSPKRRKSSSLKRNSACDELLYKLDVLIDRQEKIINLSDERPQVNKEWHVISEVLDRSLFWVYTVILIMSTVVILVIVPLGKSVTIDE